MPARGFKLISLPALGLVRFSACQRLQANLTSRTRPGGGSVPARGFKLLSHQTLALVEVLCQPEASS